MREEHPHLSLVRRLWDAGARGDANGICELFAPDAVMRAYGAPGPLTGEFKGIAEIIDYLARAGEIVDESCSEVIEVYTSDTGAVIRYRTVATRGAKQLDLQYLYILAIEQGRIVGATIVPTDQRRNEEFWRSH